MPGGSLSESGDVVISSYGDGDAGLRHLKLELYLALSFAFCVVYFSLQRFPLFPTQPLRLTSPDRAIGFHPEWIYVYQSVYLLVPLFPFLARTREQLMQYTLGFGVLCGISFLIFALVPIVCPRPDDETAVAMFRQMLSYDGKINTFPSLHVGLSVYSVRVSALADGGGILLADAARFPGTLIPIWGADHYLQPSALVAPVVEGGHTPGAERGSSRFAVRTFGRSAR